jgi:predicted nucleotidyltransferase
MAKLPLDIPRDRLAAFCRRWRIVELGLFGSALREDFSPESDIDVLVTFAPGVRRRLADLAAMEEELRDLLGREVDLVERRAVEQSENYIRRRHILKSVEPLYVAG